MIDLELRFCSRGRIAERVSLELRSAGSPLRAGRATRSRVATSKLVFEARAQRRISISMNRTHFEGRFVPADDEPLVEALQALAEGREKSAEHRLGEARNSPDAAFLCGALALLGGRTREAERSFDAALAGSRRLGRALRRHRIDAKLWLDLSPKLALCVRPERESILFAHAQLLRELGREEHARAALADLRRLAPQDPAIRLCLADLLLARKTRVEDAARRIVRLTDGVTNSSTLCASLLLFRARALRRLGRSGSALDLCTRFIGRASGRPRPLLLAFGLERARAANDLRDYETERRALDELARLSPGYAEARTPVDLGALS